MKNNSWKKSNTQLKKQTFQGRTKKERKRKLLFCKLRPCMFALLSFYDQNLGFSWPNFNFKRQLKVFKHHGSKKTLLFFERDSRLEEKKNKWAFLTQMCVFAF